jgi:hypothetical protein
MAAFIEARSQEFQKRFAGYTDEDKDVVRRFLVEADRNGNQHKSGADFNGTMQQLNHLLPLLTTLCPSIRPSSIGVSPGNMVQMIRLTYSHGDLIIPDFILEEVCSPMSPSPEDGCDFPQRQSLAAI